MFMFNSNEPFKNVYLQKIANKSILKGALVKEMVNNSFSESKKNRLIKRKTFYLTKIKIWAVKKIFPLDFSYYLSYSKEQTFWCLNALSKQGFGKCMHFQICLSLWELQVIRDLLCVRDIAGISLNRLLLLLVLKSSKFHRKTPVLGSLFNIVVRLRAQLPWK